MCVQCMYCMYKLLLFHVPGQSINNSDHWTWFIHHANYKITDKHTPPLRPLKRPLLQCYCSKAQSSVPLGAISQLLSLINTLFLELYVMQVFSFYFFAINCQRKARRALYSVLEFHEQVLAVSITAHWMNGMGAHAYSHVLMKCYLWKRMDVGWTFVTMLN